MVSFLEDLSVLEHFILFEQSEIQSSLEVCLSGRTDCIKEDPGAFFCASLPCLFQLFRASELSVRHLPFTSSGADSHGLCVWKHRIS